MIRLLEEITLNAWPVLQTTLMDGWVLRFANGYTRRANSVNPLYPSSQPLPGKIETCERLYSDKGLKYIFKLTPASLSTELDAYLAEAGYRMATPTSVQLLDPISSSHHQFIATVKYSPTIPSRNSCCQRPQFGPKSMP